MTGKRFTTESERINSTYSIRILKDGKVIFEVSNWNSLSTMHKRECEDIVDLLNELYEENKLVWNKIKKMESVLPYYLSCAEVRDFHSDISEETLALTKHFNKRFQE